MAAETLFKAMADPTRQRILQLLVSTELSVSELVDVLGVPQSTVSRHLKGLRDAGLVDHRSAGTTAIYSPVRDGNGKANGAAQLIFDWCQHQDLAPRLRSRLDRVLRARRSESDTFFARVAGKWDRLRIESFGDHFHFEALTALLPNDWTVLDVGAGTGYLLPILSSRFRRVIAVDPVAEMLTAATGRAEEHELTNVEFHQASARDLPVERGQVDLCIASLVLHHEPAPIDALNEFARAVRPAGHLLIIEQRAHNLSDFHERMGDRWWGFEPQELTRQVASAGFTAVDFRTLTSAEPATRPPTDAPELFVLTAKRSDDAE